MTFNLTIEDYSEKAIVIRGDTKDYKEDIKQLGGKWNSNLKGSGGWIFPKTKKGAVEVLIQKLSESGPSNSPSSENSKSTHNSVHTKTFARNVNVNVNDASSCCMNNNCPSYKALIELQKNISKYLEDVQKNMISSLPPSTPSTPPLPPSSSSSSSTFLSTGVQSYRNVTLRKPKKVSPKIETFEDSVESSDEEKEISKSFLRPKK